MGNKSYSKGICWIDDCRIPFVDDVNMNKKLPVQQGGTIYGGGKGFYRTEEIPEYKEGGRFPANLLVCDDMLNDGVISKSEGGKGKIDKNEIFGEIKTPQNYFNFGDKGTNSRYYDIDKWFDKILND